jgi:hypothetical protein
VQASDLLHQRHVHQHRLHAKYQPATL